LGSYILGHYGISEWFTDIDQKRIYWQEGEGIIASILDYISSIGFKEFMEEAGSKWSDVEEFRQRHLIKAINNKSLF